MASSKENSQYNRPRLSGGRKKPKRISQRQAESLNRQLNDMTTQHVSEIFEKQNLSTKGSPSILRTRLKNFLTAQMMYDCSMPLDMINQHYRYLVVIDFEATCDEGRDARDYPNEIIEFPLVLVDLNRRQITNQFQQYCKPVINPILSRFCTQLTGITQEQVDSAPTFPQVLKNVEIWLNQHKLLDEWRKGEVLFGTDGPTDFGKFLAKQCQFSDVPYPKWATEWIDIRKAFSAFYNTRRCGVVAMLGHIGRTFEGREHSGLCDSINIAHIALTMIEDGCVLRKNDSLPEPAPIGRASQQDSDGDDSDYIVFAD